MSSDYERWQSMLREQIARNFGVPIERLIIPSGMTVSEFAREHDRRVTVDGEAFWDANGFIEPERITLSAQTGSGNRHGV